MTALNRNTVDRGRSCTKWYSMLYITAYCHWYFLCCYSYNKFTAPSAEAADAERTLVHPALSFLVVSMHQSVHRFYSGMPWEYPAHPAADVAGHSPPQPAWYPASPTHSRHTMQTHIP